MTDKYKDTDRMSDIICDDYRLLQVISRFGLSLGVGDQTVATVCAASDVDTATFLSVVNFIKSNGRTGVSERVERTSVSALMQYLSRSHSYFIGFRLPSIRRKLIESIDCAAPNQIAFLILRFYDEFAAEVARHMEYENTHIHTYVEGLLKGQMPDDNTNIRKLSLEHHGNHAQIEKSLTELKSIVIKYYPSDSNSQLLNDVLMDLYMTEEDLSSHCHLEDTLFTEAVENLEQECLQRSEAGNGNADEEAMGDNTASDGLSEREKEVVRWVVRGLANKEIAEKMFISVNTVMTHRRNISRKLQIHSPAGLTIYALVNGLISLDEVQI